VKGRSQAEVARELQAQGISLSQPAISKRLNKIKTFLQTQLGVHEGGVRSKIRCDSFGEWLYFEDGMRRLYIGG